MQFFTLVSNILSHKSIGQGKKEKRSTLKEIAKKPRQLFQTRIQEDNLVELQLFGIEHYRQGC